MQYLQENINNHVNFFMMDIFCDFIVCCVVFCKLSSRIQIRTKKNLVLYRNKNLNVFSEFYIIIVDCMYVVGCRKLPDVCNVFKVWQQLSHYCYYSIEGIGVIIFKMSCIQYKLNWKICLRLRQIIVTMLI